jgi:hypothetical protein
LVVADGEEDGDGLGPGEPAVGDGVALGLGLGDAARGDRVAPGRPVGVAVARGRCVCTGACGVGLGEDDVPLSCDCPAAVVAGGATST